MTSAGTPSGSGAGSPPAAPEFAVSTFRWVALLGAAGTLAALIGEAFVAPTGKNLALVPLTAIFGVGLLAALWSMAGPHRVAAVALVAIVLDLGAVVAGWTLNAGNDAAVAMPMVGAVLLTSVLEGRKLVAALFGAWVAGIAGSAAAFSMPALSVATGSTPPAFEAGLAALMTFPGYVGLAWVSGHWKASATAARRAADQARRAEAAEYRSAATLRVLADVSPLPTLAFGADGNVKFWNPAAESLLGWSAAETTGHPISSFVPEDSRTGVAQRIASAITEGRLAGPRQSRFLCKDGHEVRVEIYEAIEPDADGRPVGVVVQFLDISDREAIQARLMDAQRLEAVGQLAAGIAHEFNNSLTAIAGFASLIAAHESPAPQDDALPILAAADHAATLVRQLIAFSRRVPLEPKQLDLGEFLVSFQPLVRSLVGRDVEVQVEIEASPALVSVDPSQLEQAVLNLASNARDAMPLGGMLKVAVRTFPDCVSSGGAEPEEHAAVIVSDTGEGIPASSMRHLFEPFFTTKPPGKGSGLGLAMVHGFVTQSGGHVVVTSPPGRDTTVELHFPIVLEPLSATNSHADPVGGTESILFVEDDPGVAAFGIACLRRLGYTVTPAISGTEAAALVNERLAQFDLLLTDVVTPGMSGLALARLVRSRRPDTAVLFASGYTSEHVKEAVIGPDAMLILKPYSLAQLAARVREALDTRPSV
jgi:PAS domain S-box-containing protein